MTDIKKLWKLMSTHPMGPESIVIEVEDGQINVFTISCLNEGVQDGLYVSGHGKNLEEAIKEFELDLDNQILEQ